MDGGVREAEKVNAEIMGGKSGNSPPKRKQM
jgi:hypothetical protein